MSAITHLDNESRGAYMNILCHLWEVEFSTKKDLIFVGFFEKKETKKVLEKWSKIECFLCVNNDGFYYSKRMEDERAKALQRYEKNRINGEKGGRKKAENANPMVSPLLNPMVTPQGNLNNNPNSSEMSTTQSQSHISNIPTEYIDKKDTLSLAQAQEDAEIERVNDEAYQMICQGEENQQDQYFFEPSKLRNAPKSMQEVEEAYKAIVNIGESKGLKSKTSLEFWYKHWEFKKWTDDNGKPIKWESKLSYNAFEPFFDKKEDKVAKPQTQYKKINQPLYDTDSSRATLMNWYDKMKLQEV